MRGWFFSQQRRWGNSAAATLDFLAFGRIDIAASYQWTVRMFIPLTHFIANVYGRGPAPAVSACLHRDHGHPII